MPLILNIDTATELASVGITLDGSSIGLLESENQKQHASFVHEAVKNLLKNTGYKLKDFDAFATTSGPGSYTGLRVGMATAKGFCFALSKPLITINTLEVMTKACLDMTGKIKDMLFCPMIDARRMEVFAAIYNSEIKEILSPAAVILVEDLFKEFLVENRIIFFGNGSKKFEQINSDRNGLFTNIQHDARHLGELANIAFHKKDFANMPYSQPTYFKEFHSITKTN